MLAAPQSFPPRTLPRTAGPSDPGNPATPGTPSPAPRGTQPPGTLPSLPAQQLHQSETGKEPAAHVLVGASFSLSGRPLPLVRSVAVPPTTPQPERRAPDPDRSLRSRLLRRSQRGKEGRRAGEAEQLTPTKMVAVFRPGCLSSGRNTDIPVTQRTSAPAPRADLSNR